MPLRRVMQEHDSGCFIACVAMLNGITYRQAFNLIHPTKNEPYHRDPWHRVGMTPDESMERLAKLGMNPRVSRLKYLRSLKRNALIMIRWYPNEPLMHGIVYDAGHGTLLDPDASGPRSMQVYQRRVERIVYLKPLPKEKIEKLIEASQPKFSLGPYSCDRRYHNSSLELSC